MPVSDKEREERPTIMPPVLVYSGVAPSKVKVFDYTVTRTVVNDTAWRLPCRTKLLGEGQIEPHQPWT